MKYRGDNHRVRASPGAVSAGGQYIADVLRWRELWLNLAATELASRFRGSALGAAWLVIQPLVFTAMLCAVFSQLSRQDPRVYSAYAFTGIVIWGWLSESVLHGGRAIVDAQSMMRQTRLPLAIFGVKAWLVATACFSVAFLAAIVWAVIALQVPPSLVHLLIPLNSAVIALALLPCCIASSILGALFRDYQQAMQVVLQSLWFLSPVFVDKAVFLGHGLRYWDAVNPVSAMLTLVRDPLLASTVPPAAAYVVTLLFASAASALAAGLIRRHEADLIFHV